MLDEELEERTGNPVSMLPPPLPELPDAPLPLELLLSWFMCGLATAAAAATASI